ncbi:type II toxin-antitoxin system Phd/YefM family antitoxin [Micrococcaceae bacterium Sec5.7]
MTTRHQAVPDPPAPKRESTPGNSLAASKSIGVRELRQHASSILEQVQSTGESITVTNHGKPQAVIHPITADFSWHEQLITEGRLIPPTANWRDTAAVAAPAGHPSTAELLDQSRADRL